MAADAALRPWLDALREQLPALEILDVHTHIGGNDPDGITCTPEELVDGLRYAGARAVVFPMHEPGGYAVANDRVLREAAASGGRLVPFCRVDPAREPAEEARRCLDAGARGVKVHPRAERVTLGHPGVAELVELLAERRLPLIVHAGRGIPALGRDALALLERHAGARIILAHAGISDLAWIWREAEAHGGLFFDTAWSTPADLMALLALVPPGRVLHASDAPYGAPVHNAILTLRCGLEVGLGADALRGVMGAQAARLLAGDDALDLGPAPGPEAAGRCDLLLDRVSSWLVAAANRVLAGDDGVEPIALARLACDVPPDAPQAPLCRSVLRMLDDHAAEWLGRRGAVDELRFAPVHQLLTAATLARTPRAPLP